MKKSIFLALLFLCTVKYTFAQFHSGGIKRHQVEKDGVPMKKENFENRLDNKTENFTKYFNWTPEQYAVLLSNEILSYYAKEATGIEKYWSLEDIKKILRDSTVILPPSHFNGCWQTCGMVAGKNGKAVFKWFSRNARSVANGDAKTDEMFVCVVMKAFGGKPLPILSLNCGNGVRSTCVERIVYEELEREIPNLGDDVREYEPVENFEYEYVYEDVTPPEIHTTVIRRQTDVPQQQVVYNNEPQQLVYQNPPQNRLMYNYYGGGNNAGWMNNVGWGAGFQQPSNYSNQQSWANNQSATSSNVNDNSNVFNNNTNVSYTSQPRPNTSNPNNYTSGSPAGVPGSNGLGWNGPGGVPSSGNNGGPVGVPGNGGPAGVPGSGNYGPGFSSGGGPSGAGGSSGRIFWH
jgi:hypothetical protein